MLSRVVAIVSGGGSGLGSAVSRRIVAAGGRVIIADINPQAEALSDELGESAVFVRADCTRTSEVNLALDQSEVSFNEPISAAINTAGVLHAQKTVSRKGKAHDEEAFNRVLQAGYLLACSTHRVRLAASVERASSPRR